METNQDLAYRVYTGKAEADKAVNTLRGILQGIMIDREINEKEIQELDNWCEDHYDLINRNPFQDFIVTIRDAIRGETDVNEAIEDLYWLSQKYQEDNIYYNAVTADLQTLQGICHGILADGLIGDMEVKKLQSWMNENEHLASYYPYDELHTVLQQILKDGVVDEGEKVLLKAYFNQFVRLTDDQLHEQLIKETENTKISGLCSIDPNIVIDGKTFCVTGKLTRGNRGDLLKEIEKWGGLSCGSPGRKTDYLIVGDSGNPAWAFACYGRKVEQAINLRKGGSQIIIVHELDFWDFLDELNSN